MRARAAAPVCRTGVWCAAISLLVPYGTALVRYLSMLRTLLISDLLDSDRMHVDESITTHTSLRVLTHGNPSHVVMDVTDHCALLTFHLKPGRQAGQPSVPPTTEFLCEHPDAALSFTAQLDGTACPALAQRMRSRLLHSTFYDALNKCAHCAGQVEISNYDEARTAASPFFPISSSSCNSIPEFRRGARQYAILLSGSGEWE